ncbi:MAG TPA: hypothetical protein VK465_01080, partial [Fibrobacteria bacterium]|nr:hypothetical protein [Fibrobacteria bacterium]
AGWKNFSQNAKIHFWKELDPSIQVYGEGRFAIVTYYFGMSFGIQPLFEGQNLQILAKMIRFLNIGA